MKPGSTRSASASRAAWASSRRGRQLSGGGLRVAARYGLRPEEPPCSGRGRPSLPGSRRRRCCATAARSWCWKNWSRTSRGDLRRGARLGFEGRIIGKLNGPFSASANTACPRGARHRGRARPADACGSVPGPAGAEKLAAARPITVCAGCPHRGTYMAINQAIPRRASRRTTSW